MRNTIPVVVVMITWAIQVNPLQPGCHNAPQKADLIYPEVKAMYVGGTLAAMEPSMSDGNPLTRLMLRTSIPIRQSRIRGTLTITRNEIYFEFSSKKGPVIKCDELVAEQSILSCLTCSQCREQAHIKNRYRLEVPYHAIAKLEQARSLPSDQTIIATLYATLVGSLFSGVIAHFAESQIEIIGPAAVGGAALAYYVFVARPRSHDNYILLFVKAVAGYPYRSAKPVSEPSELLIFKIPNRHDYYNIEAILTAETGFKFDPQIAKTASRSAH